MASVGPTHDLWLRTSTVRTRRAYGGFVARMASLYQGAGSGATSGTCGAMTGSRVPRNDRGRRASVVDRYFLFCALFFRRSFDMTLREVPVVFFAGILDELGPGFHESEYAGVLPGLGVGFRVLDGDFHSKPLCINSLNSLNHVHSVGMLMAYCVE